MQSQSMTAALWNRRFPIGTRVRYHPVKGERKHIETKTRSEAWELGSGVSVVKIDGRSGGVALSHLTFKPSPGALVVVQWNGKLAVRAFWNDYLRQNPQMESAVLKMRREGSVPIQWVRSGKIISWGEWALWPVRRCPRCDGFPTIRFGPPNTKTDPSGDSQARKIACRDCGFEAPLRTSDPDAVQAWEDLCVATGAPGSGASPPPGSPGKSTTGT
jgi:hypothetical protein